MNSRQRKDPFETVFGKPQTKHQIKDKMIEIDLIQNLEKINLQNKPPITGPNKKEPQQFTPNIIKALERTPVLPELIDCEIDEDTGDVNSVFFQQYSPAEADDISKELLSEDDERNELMANEELFEPKTEVRLLEKPETIFFYEEDEEEPEKAVNLYRYTERDCRLSSSSYTESDENAEIEGTYPSEDDEPHENSYSDEN